MDSDKLTSKRIYAIAKAHNTTVAAVHRALAKHPIEVDRDAYLKKCLALELIELDELQAAFRDKALVDRCVESALLLVKLLQRREALLGLSAPQGFAVQIVQHQPETKLTSTDRIAAAINRIRAEHGKAPLALGAGGNGADEPDPPVSH
jgi:hypothetical protein